MLDELCQLVQMADDENVEHIVGMSKERLLTVLERDIGEREQELSDDLRGKLERLFAQEEVDAAEEAGDVDQTIASLHAERAVYADEDGEDGRAVVAEAQQQMAHVLEIAETSANSEFRAVEAAQDEDERGEIEDIRASLQEK